MEQRRFGDTNLHASEIAFGTWSLGSDWWGKTDAPDRLIGRALELGVTFLDTGDAYGQGLNEEIVRRAHSEGERRQDFSPAQARRALEASLERLRTDHVDLYQLHNPRMEAVQR